MTEFVTTNLQVLLFVAGVLLILFLAGKHVGDRRLARVLAAGLAEVERERQGRLQAGFDAGWHGATR